MSITETTRRAGPYATDGSQVEFPFAFKVFKAEDVVVTRSENGLDTDLTLTTDYTVNLNPNQDAAPGGEVVLTSAPNGPTITITSGMAATQPTVFTNAGGFFPRVLNDSLDRVTILIQQLMERVSRVPLLPLGDAPVGQFPVVLPNGKFGWSTGSGTDSGLRADLGTDAPGKGAELVVWARSATALTRSVGDKLLDLPVSLKDYPGADPTGTSDSTAAIQAAYDEAQATGRALYIPDGKYLCNQLLLNNTITYFRTEKVMKIIGPGTIVNTNTVSPMITSNTAINPIANLFLFQDVTFEDVEGGAYALIDGDRIRRSMFSGVFFNRVDRAIYSDAYIQTIYFDRCTIRGGGGGGSGHWFVDVDRLFDVRITHCIVEHRGNFFRVRSTTADPAANALVIDSNVIEGLSGKAIEIGAAYASSITNNYFEQNSGGDIDCSISTAFHKGLTIAGNGLQPHSSQISDPNYFAIRWGKAITGGLKSGGNASTGNLHDTSNTTAYIDMTGDYAGGLLYKGYASPSEVGRNPNGYAKYYNGSAEYRAVGASLYRLDPFLRGTTFQSGSTYGDEVNGAIAPIYDIYGLTNPGTTPGNYANRAWGRGSFVRHANPTSYSGSTTIGWVCVTAGQGGHTSGTDRWVAVNVPTTATLQGSHEYSGQTVAAGSAGSVVLATLSGAAVGDICTGVSYSVDIPGLIMAGAVRATGSLRITLFNPTEDPIIVPAGTFYFEVKRRVA